ncbi:hypothetical protein EJ03DRAFT_330909 [Teratosphaeria nubilosa]|uniref:Uncharacterized protein n=1 Tax=Teratosphaeria nubilosa TaxID=161662 RepID=A0A6G1KZM9_9PEZI|nr:hypothetical protein EJ03DRAFT_330909 [Teratosphaeria nubilosa]
MTQVTSCRRHHILQRPMRLRSSHCCYNLANYTITTTLIEETIAARYNGASSHYRAPPSITCEWTRFCAHSITILIIVLILVASIYGFKRTCRPVAQWESLATSSSPYEPLRYARNVLTPAKRPKDLNSNNIEVWRSCREWIQGPG